MKRRGFLQTLIGMVGTTTIPATGSTQPGTTKPVAIQLLETNIAGFQFYEGQHLFPQLNVGDPLQLRRAPENKYDKQAVEVYWQGKMLGHLPRVANMSVSQMMDRGEPLAARITKLTISDNPWQCVTLTVEWNKDTININKIT